jgi:hypothetical protein
MHHRHRHNVTAHVWPTATNQDFQHQSTGPECQLIAQLARTYVRHDRRYTEQSLSADMHPGLVGGVVRDELPHAKPMANMTTLSGREKQQAVVLARKFRVRARLLQ